MELQLEVVLSSSIKRKKPWPRFCWLGKEKESVFLLDDKRISEINMISGRTRKRTPKLHPLLKSVVTMTSSSSGLWLCGLLVSGELFLWNRDRDLLKTVAAVPEVARVITTIQGNPTPLTLQVSRDGMRVLLVVVTGLVFLWECADARDLSGVRDRTARGRWTHILPLNDSVLPCAKDKEVSHSTSFIKSEVIADSCLSAFVFTSGKKIVITFLRIQWDENCISAGSLGYSVYWATRTYPLSRLTPPCQPVKSRGALVSAFSPDGQLLAVVLNQRQPKATQVLFVSTQNFVSVSSSLGGCGSRRVDIPSKYIRSYWVADVSWSPDGLFLACVLKRGSLLLLSRLGELLTLTSSGCSVDFGPAHFLPLHPLVTYRPPVLAGNADAAHSSSSLSIRDVFRQRYSVTWHPRLSYFIVSDGYMATVLRLLGKPSPALLMRTLLQDATKELQRASEKLAKSQMGVGAWLDSVSSLNLLKRQDLNRTVRSESQTTNSVLSADAASLPLFLQDQGTFTSTKELLGNLQNFFEDDSDLEGPPAGSHLEDGGRLDFASMFDTLHALDTQTNADRLTSPESERESLVSGKKTPVLHRELGRIQTKLLTAWALGMSFGAVVEERAVLLQHCLRCVGRLAAVHRLTHSLSTAKGKGSKGKRSTLFPGSVLHLLRSLLAFLPWDGAHPDVPSCLGQVVDFSTRLVRLLLTPCPSDCSCQVSSHSLSTVLLVLQQVSECLDRTYGPQQRIAWSLDPQLPQLWTSDLYHVPQLHGEDEKSCLANQAQAVPQRPSSRLQGAWEWLYKLIQQYIEELRSLEGHDGWEEEQQQSFAIMSQIQAALQATGKKLEEGPVLLSCPGEHLFLCGSYWKSCEMWRSLIFEESVGSCVRGVYKETRLCLALLYSLLSQYRLREAQELGDHMARLVLPRTGYLNNTAASLHHWLPLDLHSDAALAVIQTLGRFMASYFTNNPLYIRPPHHVAPLPPLHLPHQSVSDGRLLLLCQEEVSRAVRQQQLSEVWSVDYTEDLLLLGGLLPESAWLASRLGDWKTAVSLSLAFSNYCSLDLARLRRGEFHLPAELQPDALFQAELQRLLGDTPDPKKCREENDLLEGEDWDVLQISIEEILKASVMAGVDVLSSPLTSLLDAGKNLSSFFPVLVPSGLYLPSPPLYCPQPSPNTQDPVRTVGECVEAASRHNVSAVLQRLFLLLRSARCCRPAAQWYISHLRRARHIVYKIKKKYPYPSPPEQETDFPEGLGKFITRQGFFKRISVSNGQLGPDTVQTIVCFRELCALCWMLHVRDQLSISCRKYRAARQLHTDQQLPGVSDVTSSCIEALCWARRFLPFSCFLNAEEILQDLLLSLMSELPPLSLVAETVVEAFPQEEESVRVALREKYNLLLQRLRQSEVLEGDGKEASKSMRTVIQEKRRQRRKHLGRLRRHLVQTELHLWETKEGKEEKRSKQGAAAASHPLPSKSASDSTITTHGFQPVCSDDGDTADGLSEETSDACSKTAVRGKKEKKGRKHTNSAADEKIKTQPERLPEDSQSPLPIVGTWEFELEDEEYLHFLDLLLSYMLGKDGADGGKSFSELPLLRGFSSQLRDSELHSLAFDALTSVHRRQRERKDKAPPPVFRAGCCYKPRQQQQQQQQDWAPESQTSSIWNEELVSISSLPNLQKGLFGLRRQQHSKASPGQKLKVGDISTFGGSFSAAQPPESSSVLNSLTSIEALADIQQGLDPKLEACFPELGRLLEWMVRWADRRVPLRNQKASRKEKAAADQGGVVMRVKASTPAILASLYILRQRFDALLGVDRHTAHMQVPEMHWTVVPALRPEEVDQSLRGDSGVQETGSPGLGSTLPTGQDQEELPASVSPTDEPEEALPPAAQPDPTTQPRPSSPQPLSLDDLDVTPEKEGRSSCSSEAAEDSHTVSDRNAPEISCLPDRSLQLEDLEVTEDVDDAASFSFMTLVVPQPEPQAPPPPSSTPSSAPPTPPPAVRPAADTLFPVTDMPVVESPGLHPQCSPSAAPPAESTALDQPPQLRQRLGDDLIRLVQNINYASLMEVLASSFSNLQQQQQQQQQQQRSSSLAQSNINFSHPVDPALIPAASPFRPPAESNMPVGGVQGTRSSNPLLCRIPARAGESAGYSHPNLACTSNGEGVNQDLQPLSIQAMSPGVQMQGGRGLISPSQGLLATADSTLGPLAAPSLNHAPQKCPQLPGLKLLQLHPTLLTSDGPPTEASPSRWAEPRNSNHPGGAAYPALGGRVPFSSAHDPVSSRVLKSEQMPRGQEVPLPVLQSPDPAPMQGLRLLHCHSPAQNDISALKLPRLPSFRPGPGLSLPTGDVPIKLLQIESGPKMMLPASPAPLVRLLSMEQLTGSAFSGQSTEERQLPQHRVEPQAQSTSRQKRREGKEERRRKSEVTFRPNESIIPPQEPIREPVIQGHVAEPQVTVERDAAGQFGSAGSPLTGARLLQRAVSTSAELHAFASTCKNPPECHDAFTNTDLTGSRPALVDKAVAVSAPASRRQSLNSENLPCSTKHLVPDSPIISERAEKNLGLGGRQFLSVLDLEDGALHQDLPPSLNYTRPPSPTPAQLHVLATSVLCLASASDPQIKVASPQRLQRSTSRLGLNDAPCDIRPESPLSSRSDSRRNMEKLAVEDQEAPPNSELCRAARSLYVGPQDVSTRHPARLFSSRLSEMDAQLAALQGIAESLETDFSNTRMIVKTPPKLKTTDGQAAAAGKKTVRLSVPQKAWAPQPNIKAGRKSPMVAEKGQFEEPPHRRDTSTPQRRASPSASSSPRSPAAGPSSLPTPPRTRDELDDISGLSTLLEDESLAQSGLYDTAEILDELVREGYLSTADLDFTRSLRSAQHSRLEQRQSSSRMSQQSERDSERRELRIWMRRKQREQLAVYQKHREKLRQQERQPFSRTATPTNRHPTSTWRTREEKEKSMLLEHYKRRTSEAWSLVRRLSTSPPSQRTPSLSRLSTTPPPAGLLRTYSVSTSDQRNPSPGQNRQLLQSGTAHVRAGLTEEQRRRLGLHRPVTCLPGDRLSHVTRRGMISDPRSHSRMSWASQSEERSLGSHQRKMTTGGGTPAVRGGAPGKQIMTEERRQNNYWETHRQEKQKESDMVLAGLSDEQEPATSNMEWLDNLSESGSSNMSKIDWAAIERMVATGEA